MKKKIVLVVVLAVFTAGMAFGQEGPLNSVGLDAGPLIVGVSVGGLLKEAFKGEGVTPWGFGMALQYERIIFPSLSAALKFGYLGYGLGMTDTETDGGKTLKTNVEAGFHTITLEAHVRWYPGSSVFFLDGMLGYGNLSAALKGTMIATDKNGRKEEEHINYTIPRNYFNYGAKIGWRVVASSGFTFEPSFGYYGTIGLGDTLGKAISKKLGEDTDSKALDDAMKILEDFIFFGGPRIAFVFGWSF